MVARENHHTPTLVTASEQTEQLYQGTQFLWVPVGVMFAAPYERPLSQHKVDHILAHWDLRAVGVLYLSERRVEHSTLSSFAILDGRHRREAASQKGVETLPALVYTGLSYAAEADLYVKFATVHQQSALDRFRARIQAGEHQAVEIQNIVEQETELQLPLATTVGGTGYLNCVFTLERLHQQFGGALLRHTCQVLAAAYGNQQRGWNSTVLNGMGHFMARYQDHPNFREERLLEKLRAVTPESLLLEAHMRARALRYQDARGAIGITVLEMYNEGLRSNKLPDWQSRIYAKTPEGELATFSVDE